MAAPLDFKIRIFLDSGAFSAWKHGTTIDIKQYIAYLKRNQKYLDAYVSLDVIPGTKMKIDRSTEAVEASALQSYRNQQIMKDAGLHPIPVFHQGENFRHLERYLNDREPCIGISPYTRGHRLDIMRWMDECFTLCTDSKGLPICKTHGFGVTSPPLVERYPWYSTDSTSWVMSSGFGFVALPTIKNGFRDYVDAQSVHLSSRADKIHKLASFDHLGPVTQDYIREVLLKSGMSLREIRNTNYAREALNAQYYIGLERQCSKQPFRHRTANLLNTYSPTKRKGALQPLSIFLGTKVNVVIRNVLMNQLKISNRLYSYYETRRFSDEVLALLATTGLPGAPTPRRRAQNKNGLWGESYRIFRAAKLSEKLGDRPWGELERWEK